ncbi:hypothetical protein UYSO10_0531 [Kosakonia radicincitans]|nr:hypothetical protein UYSO10_0531 [Kosakonia radicincitans]
MIYQTDDALTHGRTYFASVNFKKFVSALFHQHNQTHRALSCQQPQTKRLMCEADRKTRHRQTLL